MKERGKKAFLWLAVLGLMVLIFAFSAQPGIESDKLTEAAAMPVAELIASLQNGNQAAVLQIYNVAGTILRKFAHLGEYALLGLLLHMLCRSYGLMMRWLPFVLGVVYAASDEIHQTFVPGRLGSPVDILIDAVGVLGGILAIRFIRQIVGKLHVSK